MKKIFTVLGLFTILFSLASCQKEQGRIIATIAHYQGDEKVYMSGNSAFWNISNDQTDDQIWVNNGTTAGSYPLQGINNDGNYYEIVMGSTQNENTVLNALYPASVIAQNASLNNNQIRIKLPSEQTYTVVGGKQVINAPMAAQATVNARHGAELKFSNLCSLLKVKVHPNVYVISITVSQAPASEGETNPPLAGTGTVTFAESGSSLTMDAGGSTSVTLTVNASREDGEFYVVIPPYAQSTKLVVTILDNPQTIITRTQTPASAMPASQIAEVNCVDNHRGLFSVSATDKVSFARGNLTTVNGSYTFTTNQYDLGTTYTQADIETYSTTMGSEWFILDEGQWRYLLASRDSRLKVRSELDGVKGLVLLPDDWFNGLYNGTFDVTDGGNMNGLDLSEWLELERYGAVFLPAITSESQNHNYYWTATEGKAVAFGSGNGQGGTGGVVSLSTNTPAHIRHAHYVVRGGASTDEE